MKLKCLVSLLATFCSQWRAVSGDSIPQDVADTFGAKCLNGAAPTFEITQTNSTKWVLFLEGGGWCYGATENETKISCARRGGFVWPPKTCDVRDGNSCTGQEQGQRLGKGSRNREYSRRWKPLDDPTLDDADIGGIMSQDPAVNPDFYTWNKVFIHYCDGASFGGGRVDPVAVSTRDGQPAQMWLRGRNNFNAIVSYLQSTFGMNNATEVILSGGSAGGLAVFYNLDHLATLLGQNVRLTGFPDAGFFLDAQDVNGHYTYRGQFLGADPVWNVTASGGTNANCLAANAGEEWKCLLAQYIVPHIETPIFVMNSLYDAYQTSNILFARCIPTPSHPCTAEQNASLRAYRDHFVNLSTTITDGKPRNGVYFDACYVHEQNVNYCSNQNIPNCVGWTPAESGSKKWGYTTAVTLPTGEEMTPQQAFSAYYRGTGQFIAIDADSLLDNPTCNYLGHPVYR